MCCVHSFLPAQHLPRPPHKPSQIMIIGNLSFSVVDPDQVGSASCYLIRIQGQLIRIRFKFSTKSEAKLYGTFFIFIYNTRIDQNIENSDTMTFWCGSGSGSADPCLGLLDTDPDADPDPAFFVIDKN